MNSTRDETPSLQLSMALARGGSTSAADSSFRPALLSLYSSVHIMYNVVLRPYPVSAVRWVFLTVSSRTILGSSHGQRHGRVSKAL
jgi:hypothetical protein